MLYQWFMFTVVCTVPIELPERAVDKVKKKSVLSVSAITRFGCITKYVKKETEDDIINYLMPCE